MISNRLKGSRKSRRSNRGKEGVKDVGQRERSGNY